jgi:hypothetical protein
LITLSLLVAVQVGHTAVVRLVALEDFVHLLRQLAAEALLSQHYLLIWILLTQSQ